MATVRFGGFEWGEGKARENAQKHAVSFEEAMTAFADPLAVTAPDLYEPGRMVTIGMSVRGRVLFIVHAERGRSIRIISARKASRGQRRKYEEEE
jgi:uncharacterized DUF497 family protein